MERSDLWDKLVCMVFPPRCVLCGQVVEYRHICCPACHKSHPPQLLCGICGGTWGACGCHNESWAFASSVSPFLYQGEQARSLVALKQKPHRRTLAFFGAQMAQVTQEAFAEVSFSVVVPVPQASSATKRKGFNHAELLAQQVAQVLALPVRSNLLVRREQSLVQHTLNRQSRMSNAMESYQKVEDAVLTGETVLLVDDIVTTGATAQACAHRLCQCGAGSVYVVSAASTATQKAPVFL